MCELYLQCDKGAAGDMISAALMELVADKEEMLKRLNTMEIPGVEYILEKKVKYGIEGNSMTVRVHGETEEEHGGHFHENHHHHHMTMENIKNIIDRINASSKVKRNILEVYRIIAAAESKAHGCPVSEIHFHEVGAMDAIADVAAVCALMEELDPSKVLASEIHVGNGTVSCAHGVLPVPAPATANILQGLPCAAGEIDGEICTPTGAALLKYFVDVYGEKRFCKEEKSGIGLGKRTFSTPSYFKAYLI